MLPTTLARTFQVHLGVETRRVAGSRRQAACGGRFVAGDVWQAACGVQREAGGVRRAACGGWDMMAEIMTSVDIVV
jgi:hypothetical protein